MGEGLEKNIICITKEEHFDQHEQGETRKREVWAEHLESSLFGSIIIISQKKPRILEEFQTRVDTCCEIHEENNPHGQRKAATAAAQPSPQC